MPSPRVFISSSYVDLIDARSVIENYFRELFYETVSMERGGIHYDHTKPMDISCYKAVKECDLMILIIGSRYGSPATIQSGNIVGTFNSITKEEYLEALSAGIPIFTFVKNTVYNEYFIYINQAKEQRKKYRPKYVDNIQIFHLIKEILELRTNNVVFQYDSVQEILTYLKKATADLVHDAIKGKKHEPEDEKYLINGYKLFYHRRKQGLSLTQLAEAARIKRNFLATLEKVRSPEAAQKHGEIFRACPKDKIEQLEQLLKCPNQLTVGKEDDLLSVYIQYYHSNKGKLPISPLQSQQTQQRMIFPTKCVIFDFDGTLSNQKSRTTWELIWEELGYSLDDCAKLHREFSNKIITHREWCEKTCLAFNNRSISEDTLRTIAAKISLVVGVKELIEILSEKKIEMHILSGSISQIIHLVLNDLCSKFTHIQANTFKFNGNVLSYIQSTDFDFEGKATYISNLMSVKHYSPTEILFVGNSSNDKYVSRSGVPTLCVNPHFTDGNDEKEWLYCIREMGDMREILKYINLPNDLE